MLLVLKHEWFISQHSRLPYFFRDLSLRDLFSWIIPFIIWLPRPFHTVNALLISSYFYRRHRLNHWYDSFSLSNHVNIPFPSDFQSLISNKWSIAFLHKKASLHAPSFLNYDSLFRFSSLSNHYLSLFSSNLSLSLTSPSPSLWVDWLITALLVHYRSLTERVIPHFSPFFLSARYL